MIKMVEHSPRRPSPSLQAAILARDGMTCQWCGCAVVRSEVHRPDRLHFDHVIQWSHGGPTTLENLVVSCAACNGGRARQGGNVRQPLLSLVVFSHQRYTWARPVALPRVLRADEIGLCLAEYLQGPPRQDPARVLSRIMRGQLAATDGEGRIYVEIETAMPRSRRQKGRAR